MEDCKSVVVVGCADVTTVYVPAPQLLGWVSRKEVNEVDLQEYLEDCLPLGEILGAGTSPGMWFDPWGAFAPEEVGEVCWGASPSCNLGVALCGTPGSSAALAARSTARSSAAT